VTRQVLSWSFPWVLAAPCCDITGERGEIDWGFNKNWCVLETEMFLVSKTDFLLKGWLLLVNNMTMFNV